MWKQNIVKRKLIGVPIVMIYMNLLLILWPQSYDGATMLNLLTVLLFSVFIGGDVLLRPLWVGEEKDQFRRSTIVILLLFLAVPFLLHLPYIEYQAVLQQFIPSSTALVVGVIGNLVLMCGGVLMVWSRILLGPSDTPMIVIRNHHQLVTHGAYRHIRHPLYMGYILLLFGYAFAFDSLLCSSLITVLMLSLAKSRMDLEEKLLLASLGRSMVTT